MKKVLCLLAPLFISGCITPKCDCRIEREFCDALIRMDDKIIEMLQRDKNAIDKGEIKSLRDSAGRTIRQKQNTDAIKK